jgi:hypothetical protein
MITESDSEKTTPRRGEVEKLLLRTFGICPPVGFW